MPQSQHSRNSRVAVKLFTVMVDFMIYSMVSNRMLSGAPRRLAHGGALLGLAVVRVHVSDFAGGSRGDLQLRGVVADAEPTVLQRFPAIGDRASVLVGGEGDLRLAFHLGGSFGWVRFVLLVLLYIECQ